MQDPFMLQVASPVPKRPAWVQLRRNHAKADDLLAGFEVAYPPVDIEKMARRMGVEIRSSQDLGSSGMLEIDEEATHAVIHVRRDHVAWRQRFTVAHEIGHLMLHSGPKHFRDITFAGTPEEAAANRYAADLLMPLWMLEPLVLQRGVNARYFAQVFQVSEEAINVRLGLLSGLRR